MIADGLSGLKEVVSEVLPQAKLQKCLVHKIRNSFPNPDSALNLIVAYLMDFEQRVYKYPVSSFIKIKDTLDDKFYDLRHN